MDKANIGIGAIAVAALVVALMPESSKDAVAVSAGEADVAVLAIAQSGDAAIGARVCEKQWAAINGQPEALVWLCDGAYLPDQQAWLDKTAGKDGVRIVLEPRTVGKDVVFDATIHNGQDPERPRSVAR
jgi:hypothetical protein